MEKLCARCNIECHFINAVYGKALGRDEIDRVYDKGKARQLWERDLASGEIGCALSHRIVYETMVNNRIENAIVLEDDVIFDESLHQLADALENFPVDWQLVLLSYYRMTPFKKKYSLSLRGRVKVGNRLKLVRFVETMHSTAGYLINRSGARRLLGELDKGIHSPIDHYTGDEQFINLYGVLPRLVEIDRRLGAVSSIAEERDRSRGKTREADSTSKERPKKSLLYKVLKKICVLFPLAGKLVEILYAWYAFCKIWKRKTRKCFKKPRPYERMDSNS